MISVRAAFFSLFSCLCMLGAHPVVAKDQADFMDFLARVLDSHQQNDATLHVNGKSVEIPDASFDWDRGDTSAICLLSSNHPHDRQTFSLLEAGLYAASGQNIRIQYVPDLQYCSQFSDIYAFHGTNGIKQQHLTDFTEHTRKLANDDPRYIVQFTKAPNNFAYPFITHPVIRSIMLANYGTISGSRDLNHGIFLHLLMRSLLETSSISTGTSIRSILDPRVEQTVQLGNQRPAQARLCLWDIMLLDIAFNNDSSDKFRSNMLTYARTNYAAIHNRAHEIVRNPRSALFFDPVC